MSIAVRVWEDNFKILSKIRSKSERNALCFALIYYGFCGEIPQDLKLNKNNLILFDVLKNNFIAKNQGGAPVGNFNRCSTVEKNKSTDIQPLSENIKQKTENIIPPKNNNSNELIILSPYNGFEKCSCDCERKARFQINDKKFCGQHTRIELTKLGRLDLLPEEKKDFIEKFEEFWKEYTPVKCNGKFVDKGSKKTAYEKFVRILEKGEDYENIIRGVREYINHCKENGQLTCGATVFLNQERWKCDYGATINGESHTEQRQSRSILETYAEIAHKYQQT